MWSHKDRISSKETSTANKLLKAFEFGRGTKYEFVFISIAEEATKPLRQM
jgi:hypothetical protein